jgi:anaerobic selenocysteine-containing dehydrogenase
VTAETVTSFCRMCGACCGVRVTVEDGAALRLAGDRDHPLSLGYACPKGRRMIGLVDDPAVLDEPLMRDRRGRLVPVDWETALGDLGAKLNLVLAQSDPYAIGLYTGTSQDSTARYAASRLMSAVGSPSTYTSTTVDSIGKVLVPKLMAGREGLVPAVDFDATTLLLIVGENMVVSHGGFSYFTNPVWYLRKITQHGELWVIDPRHTETARLASRHLSGRSGSDFAVFAYLIRALLRDGADQEYLRDHARRADELRAAVEPFDLATASRYTGLGPGDLEDLLRAVRRHRRLAVVTGTGVTMAATGTVTEWLAYALQVVTGSFERPGGRWFNHGARFWPSRMTPPDTSAFGPGPRTHPQIPRIAGQFPCAVLPAEIEQGHLRALLVMAGNPVTAFPQPQRLSAALGRLPVLAVWDIVRSATAELATHVFPCLTPLERGDLITPVQLSAVLAQYTPPVVPPRGARRPVWWSMATLGRQLGVDVLPGGLDPDTCSDEDICALLAAGVPATWAELRDAAGPVEFTAEVGWVQRTALPDGRWDLAPPLLAGQLAGAVSRLDLALSGPADRLVLGNRRERTHVNSTLTWNTAGDPAPGPYLYLNPADAARAAVSDGDRVEVSTPHGSVTAVARLDDGMSPGTVVIPHGFAEPNVGHLTATDADLDPLTGMPMLVGVPVTLRAVNDERLLYGHYCK